MPFNKYTLSSKALTGFASGSVAWGDCDNDGDLDILLTGSDNSYNGVSKVYRNDSGTFTDISANLTPVKHGDAAWGDYDSDGDLDILLTGLDGSYNRVAKLYRNDSGTFTDTQASLTGVSYGDAAWGDYDNDGDLDILLTGVDGSDNRVAKVYRNDSGTFTDTGATLIGVSYGSAAWGDYDNDGDLDILLTGSDNSYNGVSKVYRNDSGTFTDISANLTRLSGGDAAWGDYDSDGDLDILLTGTDDIDPDWAVLQTSGFDYYDHGVAKVYRNDSGTFTDISASLTPVTPSSAAWGDYDNDGDLDIQLTGNNSSYNPVAKVYRNDSGTFTDISASLTPVRGGSVAWGDYDNDRDLDILLMGDAGPESVIKVYRNDSGTFTDISENLTRVYEGSLAWGDYDSDGDLDILLTGDNSSDRVAKVYRNDSGTLTDTQTSLTRVSGGSAAWGDYDSDGDLDILLTGNSDSGLAAKVYRNDSGTFTDISANLTGVSGGDAAWGDYDSDGDLDILLTGNSDSGIVTLVYRNDSGTFTDISANLTGVSGGDAAWGDYDSDGDLDILLTGYNSLESGVAKVYRNNSGTFTDTGANLTGVSGGSASWGDYDKDGNLDILLAGYNSLGEGVANVYRNDSGTFTDTGANLTGVSGGSAVWGDYDSNGDLDILLTSNSDSGHIAQFYHNDSVTFTDISANLTGVSESSVAWGDYDSDGDLDILLTGNSDSGVAAKVYRNDSGTFTDTGANLTGVYSGDAAWGDYDSDGDLDILLTGYNSFGKGVAKVYRNDSGTFTDIGANLTGVISSSAAWGDYDSDGDLDILLTGADNSQKFLVSAIEYDLPGNDYYPDPLAKVYRNDSGTFTDISANLTAVDNGSAAWGDYDKDGNLDILVAGADNSGRVAKVYRNDSGTFTDTGANLTAVSDGDAAWGDYDSDGDLDILLAGNSDSGIVTLVYRNDSGTFSDTGANLTGVYGGSVAWGDYDSDGDLDILVTGKDDSYNRVAKVYRNDSGTFTDTGANLTGVSGGDAAWGDYDSDGDLDILLTGNDGSYKPVAKVYRNDSGTFTDTGANGGGGATVPAGDTLSGAGAPTTPAEDTLSGAGVETLPTEATLPDAGAATIPPPATLPSTGTDIPTTGSILPETPVTDSAGDDTITGNSSDNNLSGGTGNDLLWAGTGNDTANGGDGDDLLFGNKGDELLNGGTGNDTLFGGQDSDTAVGSTGNDILCGDRGFDSLISGEGNDLLFGGKGDDTFDGGTGNDTLYGGKDADILTGSGGEDWIAGNLGNDTLTGGSGSDYFVFNTGAAFVAATAGVDLLTDFVAGDDKIVLDKSAFTALTSAAGFGFSVAAEFATVTADAAAGTTAALIVYNSVSGKLFYNQNGTAAGFGTGDQFATLAGAPDLAAADFMVRV